MSEWHNVPRNIGRLMALIVIAVASAATNI
jgi:hypothetical protein